MNGLTIEKITLSTACANKAIGNAILNEDEFAKSTVKAGEEAMALYNELFYFEDKNEVSTKLQQLKKYCQTDTFVLFKIFEKLKP